ncbi:hypothetical protein HDU96_007213 [Phlyctochytrium bullatum]|nr:hypothetical protein HDU96_007213 [Phlyctochytrium bullatum]
MTLRGLVLAPAPPTAAFITVQPQPHDSIPTLLRSILPLTPPNPPLLLRLDDPTLTRSSPRLHLPPTPTRSDIHHLILALLSSYTAVKPSDPMHPRRTTLVAEWFSQAYLAANASPDRIHFLLVVDDEDHDDDADTLPAYDTLSVAPGRAGAGTEKAALASISASAAAIEARELAAQRARHNVEATSEKQSMQLFGAPVTHPHHLSTSSLGSTSSSSTLSPPPSPAPTGRRLGRPLPPVGEPEPPPDSWLLVESRTRSSSLSASRFHQMQQQMAQKVPMQQQVLMQQVQPVATTPRPTSPRTSTSANLLAHAPPHVPPALMSPLLMPSPAASPAPTRPAVASSPAPQPPQPARPKGIVGMDLLMTGALMPRAAKTLPAGGLEKPGNRGWGDHDGGGPGVQVAATGGEYATGSGAFSTAATQAGAGVFGGWGVGGSAAGAAGAGANGWR